MGGFNQTRDGLSFLPIRTAVLSNVTRAQNRTTGEVSFRTSSSCRPCPQCSYASRQPPPRATGHREGHSERRLLLPHLNTPSRTSSPPPTLTSSLTSFLTCLRLDLRSMVTLCFPPSKACSMASADMRTFFRAGFFTPPSSTTFSFRSEIYQEEHLASLTCLAMKALFPTGS